MDHGEESKSPPKETELSKGDAKQPYRKPILRSTEAFEKLALQSCAESETEGFCLEL